MRISATVRVINTYIIAGDIDIDVDLPDDASDEAIASAVTTAAKDEARDITVEDGNGKYWPYEVEVEDIRYYENID
jgi:hypothetical protein